MDEECYPAISMTAATNGQGRRKLPTTSSQGTFPPSTNPMSTSSPNHNRTLHHHTYAATERARLIGDHGDDDNLSDSDESSIDSDEVDIDDSMIKEEPLSPSSSCPPSPVPNKNNTRSKNKNMLNNINLSQMAALTNTDLVFEHTVSACEGILWKLLVDIFSSCRTAQCTSHPRRRVCSRAIRR